MYSRVLASLLLVLLLVGCSADEKEFFDSGVLATVGGVSIHLKDVTAYQKMGEFSLDYKQRIQGTQNAQSPPSETDILKALIECEIVRTICVERGVALSETEIKQVEALRSTALTILDYPEESGAKDVQDMVRELLDYTGITLEEYGDYIYAQFYANALRHKLEGEYFQGDSALLERYITEHYDEYDVVIYAAIG